jgi:hypothetical protein
MVMPSGFSTVTSVAKLSIDPDCNAASTRWRRKVAWGGRQRGSEGAHLRSDKVGEKLAKAPT